MNHTKSAPFFFDKPFRLSSGEKALFLDCAERATASLKRNQKHDCMLGPVGGFRLLGALATYAFLLRHLAAGRRVRYFAPFHPAGCMAAFLGHAEVLRAFEARGIRLEDLSWGWQKVNPLDFAVIGRHCALVKNLLAAHPGFARKEEWRQDAVAWCVQHGTLPILRLLRKAGMPLSKSYWSGPETQEDRRPEGTPFFLAVAADRRDMVRELVRLGEFPDPAHTGGTSAVHLASSLLSIAVQYGNFELADWLVEKGWLHDDMADLPRHSHAWKNLDAFRYLCRKFPEEDYKADVRTDWEYVFHYVSEEVLDFAWDGQIPDPIMAEWRAYREKDRHWQPGDPFPDDDNSLVLALDECPDELLRLEKEQPGRFRRMLLERDSGQWAWWASIVYLLRLSAAKGLVLFRNGEDKAAFMRNLRFTELQRLRPHLSEFGLPPVSDAEMARLERRDWGRPKRDRRAERLRKLAATPRDRLRDVLDDPKLDPMAEINANWPLALEVASGASPEVFDAWVLRGMDPYSCNSEGLTAMEVGNAKLLPHLVQAYGMSPDHVAYDGSSPLGDAIGGNCMEKLRVLVRLKEREGDKGWLKRNGNGLPLAIHLGHDEIARFLLRHGAVNRGRNGRIHPVEPWMLGLPGGRRQPGCGS